MPEGTVYVGRPGQWGNRFTVGLWFRNVTGDWYIATFGDGPTFGDSQVRDLDHSLALLRDYATQRAKRRPEWLAPLRGKDLACWCKEPVDGQPDLCHGAVLLELANQSTELS